VIRGYRKAIWNGVTTIELARAIDAAIPQDLAGLYQLTPKESINKYDLLLFFRDAFEKMDIEIEPYDGFAVDKTLVNARTDFDFTIRSYPQQIQDMKSWVDGHGHLYVYDM
jgi:dTDP-4-dehydrorhamnose reductase